MPASPVKRISVALEQQIHLKCLSDGIVKRGGFSSGILSSCKAGFCG
jgi:hypothetical protein